MRLRKGTEMGRFAVEFKVANNQDVQLAQAGVLGAGKVRQALIRGVVDSGAAQLVLPRKVAVHLGLRKLGTATVRYADQRSAQRVLVEEVRVELMGRHATFQALVEPKRETALIGAIVLEALDLVVDSRQHKLAPRDPKQIVAEIE
jgi:predicted aspartyl protease